MTTDRIDHAALAAQMARDALSNLIALDALAYYQGEDPVLRPDIAAALGSKAVDHD